MSDNNSSAVPQRIPEKNKKRVCVDYAIKKMYLFFKSY